MQTSLIDSFRFGICMCIVRIGLIIHIPWRLVFWWKMIFRAFVKNVSYDLFELKCLFS